MSKKMAHNNSLCFVALAIFVVAATLVVEKADAATYIVGDSLGWRVPTGADAYTTWAAQHTFTVGDTLVFNFPTGAHDVAPVTKEAYDACNSSSTIALITVGPATINLTSPGPRYYICTFGQHCLAGQKLAITVSASTLSPTQPPTSTPTPEIPPTPSPIPPPPAAPVAPTPAPVPETPSPSGTAPAPSPSGTAPAPSPSGTAPSSGPTPSASDVPAGEPGAAPGSLPAGEPGAAPGSLPSDGEGTGTPPSGATKKDVAAIFVTMFISTAVGFMF